MCRERRTGRQRARDPLLSSSPQPSIPCPLAPCFLLDAATGLLPILPSCYPLLSAGSCLRDSTRLRAVFLPVPFLCSLCLKWNFPPVNEQRNEARGNDLDQGQRKSLEVSPSIGAPKIPLCFVGPWGSLSVILKLQALFFISL